MSLEIGRKRDEQSNLCSRDREKDERKKNTQLYDEIGTEGKYLKVQKI
jgi:hypothetical protein